MIKGQYTIAQLKISPGISYQTLSDCKIKGQAGEHGCCEAVLELSENTKKDKSVPLWEMRQASCWTEKPY